MSDQFRQFIMNLQTEDQRPEALINLRNLLLFKNNDTANTLRNVGISKIFHCLNVKDKIQFDLACEVLKLCFDQFNVGDVVRNYTGNVMYLLRHDKQCLRQLAVQEVFKTITCDPQLLPVEKYVDVYVAVSQLVSDSDTGIANKAILITSNLPLEAYTRVLDEMKIALEDNTSSKCNAFEVIVNISSKSPELLTLSADNGYIDFMLSELQTTDVLYQMNILELLSRLAVTPHGIRHLVECGALTKISDLIIELRTNPLGSLLTPGYMKFFGCIAHLYPREIFEKYPVLLDSLFESFQTGDQTVLPIALDTLGFIGSTTEGKLSLAAIGSKYTSTVAKVGEMIKNDTTEIKTRALHCMAALIACDHELNLQRSGSMDHRVTLMTREWFRSLSSNPDSMEVLQGICKNPFSDLRLAAFALLDAVCQHNWGEDLVARTPGFIEYLLDRTGDYTKESKEAKYKVIRKLSRSAVFDTNTIMRLTKYVEEGPFYSETMMQIAMDEGD